MMMERRNATNVREFPCLGGYQHITVSASPEKFVVLRDLQPDEMRALIGEFAAAHETAVRRVLMAPRTEVEAQAVQSRVGNGMEEFSGRLQSPYALQAAVMPRPSKKKNFVHFGIARYDAVRAAANELGIQDKYAAIEGRLYSPPWCNFLTEPYEAQALIAENLLGPELGNLDWMVPGHDLRNANSRIVIDAFAAANSVDGFLSLIAKETWALVGVDDAAKTQKKESQRHAADGNRPLAVAWFAAWLAGRGIWLFPLNSWFRIVEMVPIAFESLWNGLLLPEERAKFSNRLECDVLVLSRAGDNMRMQYRRFLRWVPLVSSFHDFRQASDGFLVHLREVIAGTGIQKAAARFAIRAVWDVTKNNVKDQVSAKELVKAEERIYREGRLKKKGQRPWQWIDDEDYTPHPNEKYIPAEYRPAPRIIQHVEELRLLLHAFGRKTLEGALTALTVWLGYLATIPDEERPSSILEINRNRHVNSLGATEMSTLVDFFETASVPATAIKNCLANLRKVWLLSQTKAGRDDLICPIDLSLDSTRIANRTGRPGRTHRRAIEEEILEFIIAENKRDDFAFSRGLRRHERRIYDPELGRRTLIWWLGPAVLMDLLLNIPLRKFQARFLDSGEGDERALDISTLELTPNPLPTATKGRQEGFFARQSLKVIEDAPVLGMHINTNKSGDHYYIPWVPDDVAINVARVIDWQKRYNPITAPIRAANPHYLDSYVKDDLFIDVYPIFRDPVRTDHQPIGENGVYAYFMALLRHCQKKFNDLTGRSISFFYKDGSPIFDPHSLRVTGVTVLLEKGVDPKIVQMLVGHASQEMTFWYDAIEDRRVNSALLKALESRKPTVERLLAMDETAYANFERFLFNTSLEQPTTGTEMLRREVLSRTPGWDLMVHGICPGADCQSGGSSTKRDGDQRGVWRDRACSLCRYRVTGPAFLGGLVLNLNKLMWELRQMQREIAALKDQRDAAEDAGRKVGALHGEIMRRKVELDHLWDEWFAEFAYVRRSEVMLDEWLGQDSAAGSSASLPALLSPMGAEGLRFRTKKTADLPFLTNLLDGAKVVEGFVPPRGVLEDRNAILLEIARRNDMSDLFYRLDRKQAEAVMDMLAHTILDEVTDDDLDRLVSGDVQLAQFAFLRERLADATRDPSAPSGPSLPPPAMENMNQMRKSDHD